jgi:hypothetical protein
MINWFKKIFKKKEDPIVPLSNPNWQVSSTTGRIVYKIPVGNWSKEEAEKQLKQLISNYQTPNYYDKIGKIERILNRIQPKEEN